MSDVSRNELQAQIRQAQKVADFLTVEPLARLMIERAGEAGDAASEANGYAYLGGALVARHDGRGADAAYARSQEIFTALGDRTGVARAINGRGVVAMDVEFDSASARRYYDQALALAREGEDDMLVGIILGNLSETQRFDGDYSAAIHSAREALAIMIEAEDAPRAAWQEINIALCHFLRRRRPEAIASMRVAYEYLKSATYDARIIAWFFEVWFIILAGMAQWESAARIYGFVRQLREDRSLVRLETLMPWLSGPTEAMWRFLPQERITDLVEEGGRLTLETAERLTQAAERTE